MIACLAQVPPNCGHQDSKDTQTRCYKLNWGKHLVVDLCMRKVVDSRIFQLLAIRNSYSYSDEFCSKRCCLIWTLQIKLDGAQSDAFLPVDVIGVDFLDFYLFVMTRQT